MEVGDELNAGDLRNKLDLYGKTESENELREIEYTYNKIKSVFCQVIPTSVTGSISKGQNDTEYAEVTHKIRCRKLSIKNLSIDMYFMDNDGLRYDIEYFQKDYKNNEFWEILCKVKYE
ncbi:head-tail adaptor protein [Clostridium sp.]|uniref:head-tail adaptor protein n=1 Tax=Clostridium sp. TaxID=1506 RepID=UPI002FDE903D